MQNAIFKKLGHNSLLYLGMAVYIVKKLHNKWGKFEDHIEHVSKRLFSETK